MRSVADDDFLVLIAIILAAAGVLAWVG